MVIEPGVFGANVDFSQSMLSWSRESKRGNIWTARMFESVLATVDGRVPKARLRPSKDLWRKEIDLKREKCQVR